MLKRLTAVDWATGGARGKVEGRTTDVLDDDSVRDFRVRELDERACPF